MAICFFNCCALRCLNVQNLNSLQDSHKLNQHNKNCNVFLKIKGQETHKFSKFGNN